MNTETHRIIGFHAVMAVLKTRPKDISRLFVQDNRQDARMQEIKAMAISAGVSIQSLSAHDFSIRFEKITRHQGVIVECKAQMNWTESEFMDYLNTVERPVLLLILDGVQDPHNLGACLRSANAFAADAVIIPKDRAAQVTETVRKVSSGALENTPLISVSNLHRTLKELQKTGIWLVGMDDQATVFLDKINLTGSIGIVMGNEGQGMRRLTREVCDYLAQIPMHGTVESLNVSVATGIALYEAQRQRVKT